MQLMLVVGIVVEFHGSYSYRKLNASGVYDIW